MERKRVVRCGGCAVAVLVAGCGFTARPTLTCPGRGEPVDAGDGCTFGTPGTPRTGVVAWDADVGGYHPQLARGWEA